jgi:TRAP-type C4-dicarboxylate transport system permease large subunit
MYLLLGMALDVFGMLLLTLPFVFPVAKELGFDPVWFGIYVVIVTEIALITPPVGINVFVMQDVAPDVRLSDIFIGAIPFVLICLAFIALLVVAPGIALWLPGTMG